MLVLSAEVSPTDGGLSCCDSILDAAQWRSRNFEMPPEQTDAQRAEELLAKSSSYACAIHNLA